jgi:hypothetical protein
MKKRKYKKERKKEKQQANTWKKTKASMHDNGYFDDDNISHVIY